MAAPADFGSAKRIITMALRDVGKIGRDQEPDSQFLLDGMNRLADILLHQQTKGLTLWLLEDINVPLTAGDAHYTFGPSGDVSMVKPFRVEYGYATNQAPTNNRWTLIPLSYGDWVKLPNHVQTGQVTQYFVDAQKDLLEVNLWLVPDAYAVTGSVHLVMRKKATHIDNLNTEMTFPQEWYLALRWALALEFASGAPVAVQQRCQALSRQYLEDLEGWDVENVSMNLQPDTSQYMGSRFR